MAIKRNYFLKNLILLGGIFLSQSAGQERNACELESEFDEILHERFRETAPGAVVLAAIEGEIVYKKAFGMADIELQMPMKAENVFKIGSITKQFTAAAIMKLTEQGRLSLQDTITKFIPDYPTQGYRITIEHLLTHTSGIKSYTAMDGYFDKMAEDLTPQEMIDYFKFEPMKFAPGTKYEYNNSGYFLLGYIIEIITGKSYGEYLKENFFDPLNMRSTFYGGDSESDKMLAEGYTENEGGYEKAMPLSMTQPYSAGSILSTVDDLYKWHRAIHSNRVVSRESLKRAFSRYKLADGTETEYGYGWGLGVVQGSPTIDHGGGINGYKTLAIYLPEEDVFVAFFTNCECAEAKEIAVMLSAIAIGKPINTEAEIRVDESILENYIGVYEVSPEFSFSVSKSGDRLFVQAAGQEKFEIFAVSERKFYMKINDAQIEFIRESSGRVSRAILNQNGRQTEAEKVK